MQLSYCGKAARLVAQNIAFFRPDFSREERWFVRHKLVRASEFSGGTGVNATLTRGALHDREEGFLREKCVEMRENAGTLRSQNHCETPLCKTFTLHTI